MIKHIVLFKFRAFPDKQGRMEEIKKRLEQLPATISELQDIHIGINANPAEKWDMSLEASVSDLQNLQIYAVHPAHQAILQEFIKPILEERACVDYSC